MIVSLNVSPSPHIHDNISTRKIMLMVIIALMPACIAGVIIFGPMALVNLAVCTVSSVFFEYILRRIMKKPQTISDLSAVVTGMLLGMNLPPEINPLFGVIGSFVAIGVTKQLFGGIGQNFANPAIVARIVLMVSFTPEMTRWAVPQYWKESTDEIVTAATPLVSGDASVSDLFFGFTGGSLGETCAIALLIGGLYLIVRKIISPVTPVAFIGTVAVLTFILGVARGDVTSALNDTLYQVLAGGLILGAFFMATDYVTTPTTAAGKLIFGVGCGLITFVIRQFGGYPEGVSFSILLMNILTPYIDTFTMTKPIGSIKEEKAK